MFCRIIVIVFLLLLTVSGCSTTDWQKPPEIEYAERE